ncbi:MAG: hypothetical protein KatS3mg105_2497 [Gemmatales bacterium]|nr:MAG: hypothetical protein KatS3mg105_2497 [Gemmatales bacterium]
MLNFRSLWPPLRRIALSWYAPVALGLVLLIIFAWWVAPRRTDWYVSADGGKKWPAEQGIPRQVLWEDASFLDGLIDGVEGNLLTPRFADNGATLYFSFKPTGGDADIYRSRFSDGEWQKAEPVRELNSAGHDLGPVISRDGKTLYFYSDRPGGQGGFDLYVAKLTAAGWSTPRNLGPKINTAAHEYDPAIDDEELRLFFSSNRTPEMNHGEPDPGKLNVTIRAHPGGQQFDLFRSVRRSKDEDWPAAEALADLNRPDTNEGAPYFSRGFLYFASDRPAREGEPVNLDLYRVRYEDGKIGIVENLGPAINTPAHETEPGLSPEGFTLVFARERDGINHLYVSSAQEVYAATEWDTSRWNMVAMWWWKVLLLTGLLAALVALLYYSHGWLLEKATAGRFFLASVMLHLLLVLLFSIWQVGKQIVEQIRETELTQMAFSNQTVDESIKAFEKVADLEALPTATVPKIERAAGPAEPISEKAVTVKTPQTSPTLPFVAPKRVTIEPPSPKPTLQHSRLVRRFAPPNPVVVQESLPEPPTTPPARPASTLVPFDSLRIETPRQTPTPTIVEEQPSVAKAMPIQPKGPPTAEAKLAPAADRPARRQKLKLTIKRDALASALQAVPSTKEELPATGRPEPEPKPIPALVTGPKVENPRQDPANSAMPASPQRPKVANVAPARPSLNDVATAPKIEQPLPSGIKNPFDKGRRPTAQKAAPTLVTSLEPSPFAPAAESDPMIAPLHGAKVTNAKQRPISTVDDSTKEEGVTSPNGLARPKLRVDQLDGTAGEVSPFARRTPAPFSRRRPSALPILPASSRYALRGDPKAVLEKFGGNKQSEEAVARGLRWLAEHQNADGSWSLHDFHKNCRNHRRCSGAGSAHSDSAATGMALLPFLVANNTHQHGRYQNTVKRALTWLVQQQSAEGNLAPNQYRSCYAHAIAAIALVEAYAMTRDPRFREPAQRALDYIVKAQHAGTGGWRYQPNQPGDTSVTGWQVMALKSGEMAGLKVPEKTFAGAKRWFRSVESNQPVGGTFGYTGRNASPAMTAQALLSLQLLGIKRDDKRMQAGAEYLLRHLPRRGAESSYYWYHATQVMFHLQGRHWQTWNSRLRDLLVSTQETKEGLAGSWDPRDSYERTGGRIMSTSLRILMLQVYYRHVPLYSQEFVAEK